MNNPNSRGEDFERQVSGILTRAAREFPDRIRIETQPHIRLNSGQLTIPDFDLHIDLNFEEARYLIECQDRKRSGVEIGFKIRGIKAQSGRNRFIFVYAHRIPMETKRVLETDGVLAMRIDEFESFIGELKNALRLLSANRLSLVDFTEKERPACYASQSPQRRISEFADNTKTIAATIVFGPVFLILGTIGFPVL